jgi:PAS domain S-box-containing protein
MFKEKNFPIILFCFITVISSAVLQYINPLFRFFDGGLITAILLTIFLKDDFYTKLLGIVSLILVGVSAFYPHGSMPVEQIAMQHLFSGIIVVMTMVLTLYLKRLYRSVDAEKKQVSALFEYATEGIILTNDRGEIVLANPEALSLFAYDKNEMIGRNIDILIPSKFRPHHAGYRKGYYQNPGNRKMGHGRDLYAVRKNGSEFPVEVSLSHYKQNDQQFVIAFIVDITQRKEAELILREQKEQLERITDDIKLLNTQLENKVEERTLILKEALGELEKSQSELSEALSKERELNEIKSRFVSMASHEFRTPLAIVLSSASLLSRYQLTEEQEKRDKHIYRIKNSVNHLNDLLQDFLSFGKLQEGNFFTDVYNFDIPTLLQETVDEIKALLKPGQTIELHFEGEQTFVSDKRVLKNVLMNLLGNAIKFSPENKPIILKAMSAENELLISVTDKGIGIAEEDQQYLFSTFYRGKNAVNIQGTGLGLHIVARYINLLQGKITYESKLNEGTTFYIRLPKMEKQITSEE